MLYLGPADGARRRRDGVRPAAPSLHRGAAVRRSRRRRASERERIRLEGEIPSHARPAVGLRLPHPLPALHRRHLPPARSPTLKEVEPGHFWRCHYSVEELRELQKTRRRRERRAATRRRRSRRAERPGTPEPSASAGGERSERARRRVLERAERALEVTELELAPPGPGEVLVRLHASGVCHSDLNAIDGTAPTRCPAVLGHEGAGVVEAVGRRRGAARPGTHVVLSWLPACGRCDECLRDLPPPVHDGVGRRWPPAACSTARRGSRATASRSTTTRFLSTFAEHTVVPAALLHPDPRRRAVRRRRAGRLRGHDRHRRGLADRGRAAGRPRRRVRLRRRRDERGARAPSRWAPTRSSRSTCRDDKLEAGAGARRDRTRSRWAGGAEATAERGARASAAAASTTRSRRPGGPRRRCAAFLSTRARGAAVLIGIPRADAVLALPALPIPRLERRVLGSVYGSARPGARLPRAARRSTGAGGCRSTG